MNTCHCPASTARDGHYHEDDGLILCLHYEDEDATNCPQNSRSWPYELARIIARFRHGPGVDMGGRHNPVPSEINAAREFCESFEAHILDREHATL
jgi:hypothetical protein